MSALRKDAVDAEAQARAKTLPGRPASGTFHIADNGAISADGHGNYRSDPAPVRLRSQVRRGARPTTTRLLRDATAGLSSADVAAITDEKDSRIRQMLSEDGERPWAAELFTLIAERAPRVAVQVILSYARYLRSLWGEAILDEIESGLSALRREEVVAC